MTSIWRYTRRDRTGGIDGLNLFFGALLGANLGTIQGLDLFDYMNLIVLLAITVMTIRMLSTSERRWLMLVMLAANGGLLYLLVTVPTMQPKGMPEADLHRLVATVAVWILFVVMMEFWPGGDPAQADDADPPLSAEAKDQA